jgi:ribosomal protein S18 acetylase RimI-like enzyme
MSMIRPAVQSDIDALVAIEERCFTHDRFSRRTFRYQLSRGASVTLVDTTEAGQVRGYAMVLFIRGTSLARLYSIAVDPAHQGTGLGSALLSAAEATAVQRGAAYLRLEVRADSEGARAFYRRHGYRQFGVQIQYYADFADAIRMEKSLARRLDASLARVPYYAQTLDFTCGPAALLMAMRAFNPDAAGGQLAELRLWRESTTIFMTSGLGGCSPEGLALAAARRGFAVEVFLSDQEPMFIESVRSPRKREVIRLVQEDFRDQMATVGIPIHFQPLSLETLRERFEAGGIPIVLVSAYRITREKQPHWVVVTGFDQRYVYLHDPHVATHLDKTATDCMQIPVPQSDFLTMARYGRNEQQAALIVGKKAL